MSIKIGIVMDPIEAISYKKDSSLAMLWAAQRKGWEIWYMEQSDLSLVQGQAMGRMAPLQVAMNPEQWFSRGDYQQQPLSTLDVILMRKDPPFDSEFLYSTQLLALAEQQGTLIVNRTQACGITMRSSSPPTFRNAAHRYWYHVATTHYAPFIMSIRM